MTKTTIEWTDETWNPVTGCTKVSAGCKNCYAERIANRFWGERKFTDVQCHEDRLEQPLHWRKPRRVFVNSMSDLFHDDVSYDFIRQVWYRMLGAPELSSPHIFQVLTKRPERMQEIVTLLARNVGSGNNIWLGVSAENQETADERIPLLLQTPAAVRFVSCEPLLGALVLSPVWIADIWPTGGKTLHWIICGGESGPNARPMNPDWARSLRDQCKAAHVPFFMKQMAKKAPIPDDLMVREYPA